ncbi:efflux RND transporter periplasmic adaptor subunit [Simiduia agarivorans]|uniref:RND family efflux transporter MFP subunit n=1 Tax=Simiduia agarivorans (strain DSM 21679 / JCM 13881 / BCRC 17597 / SA1) TaxID=1117647 RepID=K4KIK5_SIMAS|nr:efflux RND transporter periplasmic adaptor subunit [Simiduia agarivorans]AFU97798.1 RND family efflux transporter MFP subunit [Simiduia agarivorans SA1 = DSM 21679]
MNSKTHIKKSITHLLISYLAIALLSVQTFAETGHEEETEHDEEGHIELTQEQMLHAGITLTTATSGTIRDVLPVYGVVATNAEREQSVTARFDGIIREVKKSTGDTIRKGETLLTVEANESLKTYSITSALDGVVTQRNANVGEQTTDTPLLVIQDLSTVWVELSVFPKDVSQVSLGQKVRVLSLDSTQIAEGEIFYIAPHGQGGNQAITARVLIDNPRGRWKPGLFVNAQITRDEVPAPVVIRNEALQIVEDNPVVFVQGEEGFEPRAVTLGRTDGELSEVLSGLAVDEVYVSKNSFVLKSELGKEDAEHGH